MVHLARAGWLRWRDALPSIGRAEPGKSPALAVRVRLDDVRLRPHRGGHPEEARGLRRRATRRRCPGIASLGPDPLADDFTVERARARSSSRAARSRSRGCCATSRYIAGIGNAYSDEILHAARLSPFTPADSLDDDELPTLYDAHPDDVLGDAVERVARAGRQRAQGREEVRTCAVHGRTGQPCPVCGDTVREVSFADSSLQYCPTCQTGGKPLADRRMSQAAEVAGPPGR